MSVEDVRDAIKKLRDVSSKTSITVFILDWKLQATVVWLHYEAIQGCIDLAMKLIFAKGLKSAELYSDAFKMLCDAKVLTHEESERFSNIAKFRETLAHAYNELNLELIHSQLYEILPDIEACFNKLSKELDKYSAAQP
jgi:uncharacterized protein YutE (UPF0331/DUF86 family)